MIRRLALIAPVLLLAACQEDDPASTETPPVTEVTPVGEGASVIRPSVAEEVAPTPEPLPDTPTILFEENGSDFGDAHLPALQALAAYLVDHPASRLIIRGHSDSPGSDEANLRASRQRAEAVQAALVEAGAPAGQLKIIALGERRPAAPNARLDGSDWPEGRALNRRVDLTLETEPPPAPTEAAEPVADPPAAGQAE